MFRQEQKSGLKQSVTLDTDRHSAKLNGKGSQECVILRDKGDVKKLDDELKVEIGGIIAEIEELRIPAIRKSFQVSQERLQLFLESAIKISEDTHIKDIQSTHIIEIERFIDDLEKEALSLENNLKSIKTDIKNYVEDAQIFSVRTRTFNALSEERLKKKKKEMAQYMNTFSKERESYAKHKEMLDEVISTLCESKVETVRSLFQALWTAFNDGDKYIDVTPEYEEIVAAMYCLSLIKIHPHDSTKVKLYSDL